MESPAPNQFFYPGCTASQIKLQAETEVEYEKFREQVEQAKIKLLTKKPWYVKLFPFKVTIERV